MNIEIRYQILHNKYYVQDDSEKCFFFKETFYTLRLDSEK